MSRDLGFVAGRTFKKKEYIIFLRTDLLLYANKQAIKFKQTNKRKKSVQLRYCKKVRPNANK